MEATFLFIPGTAASSSTEADLILFKDPKWRKRAVLRFSPIPGT